MKLLLQRRPAGGLLPGLLLLPLPEFNLGQKPPSSGRRTRSWCNAIQAVSSGVLAGNNAASSHPVRPLAHLFIVFCLQDERILHEAACLWKKNRSLCSEGLQLEPEF